MVVWMSAEIRCWCAKARSKIDMDVHTAEGGVDCRDLFVIS